MILHNKKLLEAEFVLAGKSKQEVADYLGLSVNTLYRKMNEGTFKLPEINLLIKILEIKDPASIFFNPEVAQEE